MPIPAGEIHRLLGHNGAGKTTLRRRNLTPVAESVLTVDIDPGAAVAVAAEFDKLAQDLKPEARPVVLDVFCTVAAQHGPGQVRRLREEILANFGANGSSTTTSCGFETGTAASRDATSPPPGRTGGASNAAGLAGSGAGSNHDDITRGPRPPD